MTAKEKSAAPGEVGRDDIIIRRERTKELALALRAVAIAHKCTGAETIIACAYVMELAGGE